ncbi:hypothetical protein Ahy_B06g085235 isoform C [Arachis hypogaea]|uniref:Succinate dehydrogenase assembly factor 4, mitochondrial n=1 Tax=Arachis hypogaea TaxID=3818 RepID=A0A444YTW0_ARAHY|nr:hypothetical protein Ahy_B06g085235 isoform C [Arachis hypogaea]
MTTSSLPRLLSTVPNPAPYLTRSEPLTRSISNSVSRLLCSYSTQQPRENTVTEQEHAPSLSHKEESMRTEEQEQEQEQQHDDDDEDGELVNDETGEVGGPKGPEPTRREPRDGSANLEVHDMSFEYEGEIGVYRSLSFGQKLSIQSKLSHRRDYAGIESITSETILQQTIFYAIQFWGLPFLFRSYKTKIENFKGNYISSFHGLCLDQIHDPSTIHFSMEFLKCLFDRHISFGWISDGFTSTSYWASRSTLLDLLSPNKEGKEFDRALC